MPIPQFDPKDWEKIAEYREQMYLWANSPDGQKTAIKFDLGSANIVTAIAFLKAQESSEKLTVKLAKSQSALEDFTLLLIFLTLILVFASIFEIGIGNTIVVIVAAFLSTLGMAYFLYRRKLG